MAEGRDLRDHVVHQSAVLEGVRDSLHSLGNVLRDILVAVQGLDRVEADQHGRVLGAVEAAQEEVKDLARQLADLQAASDDAAEDRERMALILDALAGDRDLLREVVGLTVSARPLPLVLQVQEVLRLAREAAGREAATGTPVAGLAKWAPRLCDAAVMGLAGILGMALWTWVAPHVGRALISQGQQQVSQAPH